jgi:hypothetical protein
MWFLFVTSFPGHPPRRFPLTFDCSIADVFQAAAEIAFDRLNGGINLGMFVTLAACRIELPAHGQERPSDAMRHV